MSESNLGTAVLSLRVETGPALAALKAFRAQVEGLLGTADTSGLFKGVERDARAAGEKAGKALADGIKKQTKELKFGSFQQALDFTPKNSIKGLEDYARALRNLRDKTDLGVAGTQQLTDRLGAVDAALRQARRTTAETTAEQRRFNEALDKVALQRFSEQARGFAAGLREQARAAAANAEQFRKMREQAEGAAKAVASLAAKGVGEALKVPIFGLPKDVTSTFDKARAQIERLQQQAETASGKVARLSEGVAVLGAGGIAAKGVIDVLGGIGDAAADTTGILSQVQNALASLPGPLKGLGGLDEVFSNGAQAVSNWAASILQAQGDLSTLAAPLEAVTNSLSALGPEATLVGGALAFTFAGFQDLIARSFKPGVDGAREALKGMTADTQALIEALARASEAAKGIASLRDLRIAEKDAATRAQANPVGTEENLKATQELLEIQRRIKTELQAQFYQEQRILLTEQERAKIARQLQDAAKVSGPLALPSSEILNAEGRGIRRLSPDLGPAIDVGLQNARNFTQELIRAGQAGDQLPRIFAIVDKSLKSLVDTTKEQTLGLRVQRELLEDQLALQNQLRAVEAQRSKEARVRNQQAVTNSPERLRSRQEQDLLAVQNKRRAAESKENKRRITEAGSNALIGGAFPALFGQGLGASVGGALGGGAGGLVGGQFGFGLSLVGTALGSQFDLATQKLQTLGSALSDPVKQFSSLSEAGLISSRGLEKQIQALIDTGREAEAAALIQQDLANTYGDLAGAKELAAASDELNRSWSRLQATTASLIGVPLVDLLSDTTSALLVFAEAIGKLRNLIPKPVAKAGGGLLEQTALGVFLPGIKTLQDAAKLIPGSQGGGLFGGGGTPTNAAAITGPGEARLTELRQLRLLLVTQEVQQQKFAANETERQTVELEKQIALENSRARGERPEQQQKIVDEFNRRLLQIDERRLQLEKERTKEVESRLDIERRAELQFRQIQRQFEVDRKAASNNLADIQGAIEVQRQRSALGLSGTGVGALQELENIKAAKRGAELAAVQRKAADGRAIDLEREAQILRERQASLEDPNSGATRQEINAAIDAALQARNSAEEAKNQYVLAGDALKAAGAQVVLAAETAKGNLQDAFRSAQDAVKGISRDIEDSVTALRELQNTGDSGLNRFLSPQQVANRQAAVSQQLRPEADALANQLGIRLQVSGTREQINQQTLDFIKAARQELRLGQDIGTAQVDLGRATNDLAVVSDALVKVNSALADATNSLAQKDWAVNVSVNASTGDYAVNLG